MAEPGTSQFAELKPGDTVRFKCGGLWRGSLKPASGDEQAPVTYTSYGEGPKPLILGSRPRNRPEDWVQVEDDIWATLPMEYRQGEQLLDLRRSTWRHHQEAGAKVTLTHERDRRRRGRQSCVHAERSEIESRATLGARRFRSKKERACS